MSVLLSSLLGDDLLRLGLERLEGERGEEERVAVRGQQLAGRGGRARPVPSLLTPLDTRVHDPPVGHLQRPAFTSSWTSGPRDGSSSLAANHTALRQATPQTDRISAPI